MDTTESRDRATPRPLRITNACEACRSAKVKCQASNQLGICKRCLESKRECIFKTGPRTRRPRQPKRPEGTAAPSSSSSCTTNLTLPRPPPPPGPSKTFTIDIPMASDDDITDALETLRLHHEQAIDQLVPHISEGEDDDGEYNLDSCYEDMDHDWPEQASGAGSSSVLSHASSLPVGASALSTPPSSAAPNPPPSQVQAQTLAQQAPGKKAAPRSRTLASLGLQPQFNLDSAGQLFTTFKEVMLGHFHCVEIRDEETVVTMARERPFVLLALLAAASGSRTLQGQSLYDEEFRKILGLKFVAGGERSLELLQGLVIYIAWYPFHLRPKNKQALQYIRMAVDIVIDLELDQDLGTDSLGTAPSPERLEQIRLNASAWGRSLPLTYSAHTARCCEMLQRYSKLKGDQVLAWQVRLERLVEETSELYRVQRGQSRSEYQISLMVRGMENQLTEWETHIIHPHGYPLHPHPPLGSARPQTPLGPPVHTRLGSPFRTDRNRLLALIPNLHALYDCYFSLPSAEVNAFIIVEWSTLVLAVVLGFRMSFPLPFCPEWDDRSARELIRFPEYVDKLSRMGGGDGGGVTGERVDGEGASSANSVPRSMDVLSASKIVLAMVKTKYWKRAAKLDGGLPLAAQRWEEGQTAMSGTPAATAMHSRSSRRASNATGMVRPYDGCPMMDNSMEQYYPYWDDRFTNNLVTGAFAASADGQGEVDAATTVQNDLWAAMTMNWASQADVDFGTQDI
ncbi:Glucose transport transcription regulator RGT1 [Madurella mycetomatis]|uniref:Glucose transport transcription regulator RGT1 n=1 Tax=Madurella mycetomatis TaxID=100816 RepID=A0A175VXV7_9PEZI|nr:Glucose transport transcription regulator RGT1 [Madurella mycetomatis]